MSNEEEINAFVAAVDRPPQKPSPDADGDWYPDLNTTQTKIFEDSCKFILAYGEKGSGKTMGLLYKLVRHCYENENALALIVSPSIRTGKEGVLHDLEALVLPRWKEEIGRAHV